MLKRHRELTAKKGGDNRPVRRHHLNPPGEIVAPPGSAGHSIIESLRATNASSAGVARHFVSDEALWKLLTGSSDKTAVPAMEQHLHPRTIAQYNQTWHAWTQWLVRNHFMFPLGPSALVGYCSWKRTMGDATSSLKDIASRLDNRILICRESDPTCTHFIGTDRLWDRARVCCSTNHPPRH